MKPALAVDANGTREPQALGDRRIRGLRDQSSAAGALCSSFAARRDCARRLAEPGAHVCQNGIAIGRIGREQLLAYDVLDVLEAAAFARDAARDALR